MSDFTRSTVPPCGTAQGFAPRNPVRKDAMAACPERSRGVKPWSFTVKGAIGVLAGGPSAEREISLRSGRAVYAALGSVFPRVRWIEFPEWDTRGVKELLSREPLACAFLAMHGKFGEDGTIQGILDEMGIPYTGSGAAASRSAFDKAESGRIFRMKNIPVPPGIVLTRSTAYDNIAISYPVIVKPSTEGSSIGLSFVSGRDGLSAAVDRAFGYSDRVIVEEYIEGRELTVGILDERALPVIEIRPRSGIYDFSAKYVDSETEYIVPAGIDDGTYKEAQCLGLAAHHGLGCCGFSRVDMRLSREGRVFVLEVNTIPGMTERSLLPKAAKAAGIDFTELCAALVGLALDRSARFDNKSRDTVKAGA